MYYLFFSRSCWNFSNLLREAYSSCVQQFVRSVSLLVKVSELKQHYQAALKQKSPNIRVRSGRITVCHATVGGSNIKSRSEIIGCQKRNVV